MIFVIATIILMSCARGVATPVSTIPTGVTSTAFVYTVEIPSHQFVSFLFFVVALFFFFMVILFYLMLQIESIRTVLGSLNNVDIVANQKKNI